MLLFFADEPFTRHAASLCYATRLMLTRRFDVAALLMMKTILRRALPSRYVYCPLRVVNAYDIRASTIIVYAVDDNIIDV